MKPTFIGIGAQKCASTWLYRILGEHPDVAVSVVKEVDFFSFHFDHGYQWYEQHFAQVTGKRMVGEFSPSYFCDEDTPARIKQYLPHAKLIVSFRDPVERALSNHKHEVRVGHYTGPDFSFEAGLRNNPMYIEQGRYATHLKRWLEHFPHEQILVVFQEEVEDRPLEVAREVYRFLGVDAGYTPIGLRERYNLGFGVKRQWLAHVKDKLYHVTRIPALRWLWRVAASMGLKDWYRFANTVKSEQALPPVNAELKARLRGIFATETIELEQLLGRSLASWKNPGQGS